MDIKKAREKVRGLLDGIPAREAILVPSEPEIRERILALTNKACLHRDTCHSGWKQHYLYDVVCEFSPDCITCRSILEELAEIVGIHDIGKVVWL